MGRRKKAAKHRTRTGADRDNPSAASTGASGTGADQTAGSAPDSTGPSAGTGEGPAVVGIADDHQVAPEITVTDTNTPQLMAEADAAILMAPEDLMAPGGVPAPAGPDLAAMEAGYAMLAGGVLDMTFEMVAPAWEVKDDEKDKLAEALGKACALWFPGDIPEKWIALIVVAGVGGKIIAARRDPITGQLKPRFRPVQEAAPN